MVGRKELKKGRKVDEKQGIRRKEKKAGRIERREEGGKG